MKKLRSTLLWASALLCAVLSPNLSPNALADTQSSASVVAGKARFTVLTPTLLRVEWREDGQFIDAPTFFAVNRGAGCLDYTLQRGENDAVEIDTGRMRVHWKPDSEPPRKESLTVEIQKGDQWVTWWPRLEDKRNLGGTTRTLDGRGEPFKLEEGLLSREGWAWVDDSKNAIWVGDWYANRPEGREVDGYLFGYGSEFRTALRDLTVLGGDIPIPRRYTLGSWYSRYWPYSSQEFREILQEYASHDFPLDVMVLDMDWHRDGWTGWSWNRTLLPDAEALLADLHKAGVAATLNIHPAEGVKKHEDAYANFMKALGENPEEKKEPVFDAGSRRYLDAWWKTVMQPLTNDGVDFWWLDWQQFPETLSVKGITNLAALNRYFSEATESETVRGVSFSRWAGWGDHRYPIHFSGDAFIRWEMLAFQIPFTATAGNAGCFFWSHDIGGHMIYKGTIGRSDELYARWVQFGALSPALRSHSTRNSELDRRPWTYGEAACESMRQAFHLRSELFPYIYSSAVQSCRETWPLCRSLYLDWPQEEQAYQSATEYLFGDNLLVAPICSPGEGPGKVAYRPVWFPPGVTWFNWFTGERFEGGSEKLVAADLNETPLYARGGAPIPMQPYTARMATEPLKELVVRCWPGQDGVGGKTVFYEDDGISKEYRAGKTASTLLIYERQGDKMTITVQATEGTFAGQLEKRGLKVEFMGLAAPGSVTVGGKTAEFQYNAENGQVTVALPERSIRKTVAIVVTAKEADTQAFATAAMNRRRQGVIGDAARPNPSAAENRTLQAIGGFGMAQKNDAPYLFNGKTAWFLYAPADVTLPGKVKVRLGEKVGDQVNEKEIWSGNETTLQLSGQTPKLIEWPEATPVLEFTTPAGPLNATEKE